jgi:hypothetical protein
MVNSWIEHVRKYASDNGISYACALSSPGCKESYQPTPNYTPQLNRIATLLRNGRNGRPTPAKIQQARDLFNQTKNMVNDLPQSAKRREFMDKLVLLRTRIQNLLATA